ncbi:uncharacterized protein [Nicotiana sylvestris]|uniref:uncharacterized protein n=1 Tax=Nicotiana sylvestris TaxID=4096 RepID=UPI00388C8925
MNTFIVGTDETLDAHGAAIKELGTVFQNLERQLGQIVIILSERVPGTLPVDTERNPKETVNVVTLRSGQVLKDPTSRQKEARKAGQQFEIFLDMLKQVNVNLPDRSALPNASLCQILERDSDKEEEDGRDLMVKLTERCSAILQNKLPQKRAYPVSFTIPYSLGTINFDKSLCDYGASINLIPLSIYRKLENEIGDIRSVQLSLQLADQTTLIPDGIVEDVLVWVDKFVFPIDSIAVKMEENKKVPLILGRPFLAMGRSIIYIHERKLMLRVGEETVTFEMNVKTGV